MEETGEWIIKENGGNPEVISEVHSNINRAKSTINEVTVKLNDRRRRLETALTERQRVFDTFDDFGRRVFKLDKSLTRAKPVSPEFIIIKDQRTSHEVSLFAQFLPKNYRPYSCIWFVIVRSDSTDLHAYIHHTYCIATLHPPFPLGALLSYIKAKIGSTPTALDCTEKFEYKLRRRKQRFGKNTTTVVLDKDENLS